MQFVGPSKGNWRQRYMILLVAGICSACSSLQPSDQYYFNALETVDQSKRFVYGFAIRPLDLRAAVNSVSGSTASGGQSSAGRGSRSGAAPKNFEEMREELEIYMLVTEYCNKGYFVYDETFDGTQYLLHGECQESNNNE